MVASKRVTPRGQIKRDIQRIAARILGEYTYYMKSGGLEDIVLDDYVEEAADEIADAIVDYVMELMEEGKR